jgi:hypothetical protein
MIFEEGEERPQETSDEGKEESTASVALTNVPQVDNKHQIVPSTGSIILTKHGMETMYHNGYLKTFK